MDGNGALFANACDPSNITQLTTGPIIATIVSSVASIIGSCLIIVSFAVWSDLRTTARAILVFLAIADLFTALGYLFASILFLTSYQKLNNDFAPLCTFQSFITTLFPISSFLWTTNLAVYLFVSITLKQVKTAKKLMLLFHITAWGIPLLLCIPGAATMVLGGQNETVDQSQGTVGWCWVSFDRSFKNVTEEDVEHRLVQLHVLELVFGKFWEILAGVVAFILCIIVKISIQKKKKEVRLSQNYNIYGSANAERVQAVLEQLEQKLLWIPIFFILFRIWGTLRWIISSTYSECTSVDLVCSEEVGQIWYKDECLNIIYDPFLVYMQAIGDPGQGWGNALLYGLFHATIFKRLCPCVFLCWKRIKNCFATYRNRREYASIHNVQYNKIAMNVSQETPTAVEVTASGSSKIVDSVPIIPDRSGSINNKTLTN